VKRITTPPHRSDRLLDSLKLSNAGLAWLGLTLSIGAIGWWRNVNVIFLLAYFMLCLFFLNVCMAIAQVRRVKVIHERTKTVFAGEETTLAIAVLNPRTSSATVVVEDRLGEHSAGWLINDLKGGSSVTCYARRVFASRGLFPAHVRITSGYPIGLISFARSAGRGVVSVLPARGGIDPEGLRRWVRIQGGINERNRKVLRRVTTEPADVRGLRPYRHGDPIRTIHWRSSARRGQLVVREYDSIATPELLLVVEPWLPRLPTRQQRGDLEAALSLAVTLAVNWSRVYGTSVTFLVDRGERGLRATEHRHIQALPGAFSPTGGQQSPQLDLCLNFNTSDWLLVHGSFAARASAVVFRPKVGLKSGMKSPKFERIAHRFVELMVLSQVLGKRATEDNCPCRPTRRFD
jgi:uncharacterized protein (DUF58 family)